MRRRQAVKDRAGVPFLQGKGGGVRTLSGEGKGGGGGKSISKRI